jgi:hypothetical protein
MKNRLVLTALLLSIIGTFSCRKTLDGVSTRSDYFVKFIGDSFDQEGRQVIESADGTLYIIGTTTPSDTNDSIYLVKTQANGDVIWSKTYGAPNKNCHGASLQFAGEGLVLLGSSIAEDLQTSELMLLKTNLDGDTLWTEYHNIDSETNNNLGSYVHVLEDGSGYLLLGTSVKTVGTDTYMVFAKTTIDGKLDGSQATWYAKEGLDGINSVNKVIEWDGKYVFVGSSTVITSGAEEQSGVNAIVFLVSPNGVIGAKKTFGGDLGDDYGYDIAQLPNGNFVLLGIQVTQSAPERRDVFLVELEDTPISDPIGKHFGYVEDVVDPILNLNAGYSLVANADNTLTVCGSFNTGGENGEDMFILKVGADFTTEWYKTFGSTSEETAVSVIQTADGGFITSGTAGIDKNNMISLIKVTANGELK